jgi:hypothetical protein
MGFWWCFVEPTVIDIFDGDVEKERQTGARLRKVIEGWRNTDVNGKPLRQDSITTKITKVVSFQETICKPHGRADLLRIIRCQPSKEHGRTTATIEQLRQHVGDLLDQLQEDDFELLIELIFSSSGWRRTGRPLADRTTSHQQAVTVKNADESIWQPEVAENVTPLTTGEGAPPYVKPR